MSHITCYTRQMKGPKNRLGYWGPKNTITKEDCINIYQLSTPIMRESPLSQAQVFMEHLQKLTKLTTEHE